MRRRFKHLDVEIYNAVATSLCMVLRVITTGSVNPGVIRQRIGFVFANGNVMCMHRINEISTAGILILANSILRQWIRFPGKIE